MDTEEEKRAGSFLEKIGKRKSPMLVAALNEYLDNHPELTSGNLKIHYQVRTVSPEHLEAKIREIIEERFGDAQLQPPENHILMSGEPAGISGDILEMLSDLDMFN